MKISAAAILILCVIIDQKATVQGGFLDRLRGKDKTPDEALDGSAFSGGLSGNLKLPGNILSECSVGGNTNGNIGASTSGGIEENVNAGVNLPSCDCIRKFDTQGSVGGGGSAGFGVNGGASFSGSLAMPGMNCVESDNPPEEETDEKQDPPEEQEFSEDEDSTEEEEEEVDITTLPLCADLRRQDLQGSLGGTDTSSKVAPGNRNNDNVFEKISVIIPGVNCYEPEPPEEKSEESTEAPEESEESTEAPEESEELTEAPEESEESTEAPEEFEESTEALEESEKSEESTEEPEESEESTEAPEEAPEKNSYCYRIDIDRDIIMSPQNDFLTASPVGNEDSPATFYQTMNMDNALQFYSATIYLNKKDIYDSKPEKKMTNVCDDSYPEGSIEANIWKIINLEVMAGEGCPVQKGTGYTFRQWLRGTELTFNEPLEYGNYTLYADFDTPQGAWALKLGFEFVVDENSECTAGENFDESTEAPGDLEESEESEESTEEPEESEEPMEAPEESEESTEAPEEFEESTEALEESEKSEESTEKPEESEESTEAPEESEESVESTEEPEEAPEKNSYCYRIDIDRDIIMSPQNDFLTASPVENKDSPATFYQTMNMDNALQFYSATIYLNKKDIYDSKPEKKMTNVCDDSYPEGSIEANIWKIINLEVMAGEGCPVQKGTGHTFRQWLRGTELTFNEPLEYGNYTLHADFDTPQGAWALKLGFEFVVDENSECTAGENFDESTEAPGDLEESEESEESTEEPEESEEPMEAPEESEESTETPEESEESVESTEEPEEAPEKNSYCYRIDIDRDIIMSPQNDFLTASPVGNEDSPATFYQTMNMDNALQFYSAIIYLNKKDIYDSKPEKKMTNVCDDSYPEGSIEANIWKIINLEVMAGEGCPVQKGTGYTFRQWLRGTELTFNEPLEYGNYTLYADFDTPQGAWALKLGFEFVVDENSECTAGENFDESTEAPGDLEESEESEESTEEPEESEEPMEAPEESEESTETPEESEESVESTEEPEEAPEKNSYCYRIDIDRDIIMSPQNDFLTASPVENKDSPATFYQTMNMDNALQFYSATIYLNKKDIYDSKPEKKMTNVCDDSYPEGSIEANIWKIINLEVMAGEGCPVQKGTGHTFRQWLRGTELTFNEPLEYGNYTLHADFDTPQGAWALKLGFEFVVDENSECTAGENFDESTEAPGDLEESEESEESTEEPEESEEPMEAPEESEESTETPEESEESVESTEEPEEAPEKNSYCYRIDIDRDIIMSPQNDFLTASPVGNEDSPATFYQTMNMDNALQFYSAIIYLNKKDIYDSKPEKKMTNVCDDSYPEGSIEANIWKIINLEVMAGEGCPVQKGTGYTFRQWLRGTELTFNEPLEYGNYTLYADFDTPQGAWALKLGFEFVVDENSECTAGENFDESTEAPGDLEESEESEESTEEPEESEEPMEAPEESEESTEAPEEFEESTDALEESEKSEESTEKPEESEESTEAPEESEESVESTEEPEEAPEKNSYCYRIDIDRDIIMSPQNDFLTASPVENKDSPATFYQTMNMDNALQFYSAIIYLNKKDIYDSKPEKKMTNVCDDSYPEGSIEANIWKIINLEVMAGEGCPVQNGTGHTFRQWLRGTELTFNEPLEYGNYTLYADFDTPQGAWALKLGFEFVVDENSECTAGENFDESTETPGDLEESEESEEESEQCYTVDVDVNVVKLPIFMKVLNKPMDKDNAFIINGAAVKTNDETIYDSKSAKEMTNACEDSYPEGSFQANIWHLFNLEILNGKGCPAEQGSINSFPSKLNDTQLKINKRLEPGEYYVNLDLSAPDGTWAGATYFNFMLDGPSECKEEGEPQEPVEGESNFNCYKVDIRRRSLLVPTNDFLKAPQIIGDITAIFYQTMDMNNPLQFFRADVFGNNKRIYGLEESEKQMKSACDDSYPEGSFEANIWKIFNLSIMNGQGCPVEEGNHTFIWWLRETELYFDDPLEYGNYTVHLDFDTPQGDWALGLYFDFVVNENSTCTNS